MQTTSIQSAVVVTILAVTSAIWPATAATLTYDLDPSDINSASYMGSRSLVRAVFSSLAADQVLLHIEVTNWTGANGFLDEIGFNSNLDAIVTIQRCTVALCDGVSAGTAPQPVSIGRGSTSSAGTFSILFDYPQSNGSRSDRFERGEYATYLLMAPRLTVQSFDAFSENKKNKNSFKSYARLQGSGGSSQIYDNSPEICADCGGSQVSAIPEPGLTLLLGSGLVSMSFLKRRSDTRKHAVRKWAVAETERKRIAVTTRCARSHVRRNNFFLPAEPCRMKTSRAALDSFLAPGDATMANMVTSIRGEQIRAAQS